MTRETSAIPPNLLPPEPVRFASSPLCPAFTWPGADGLTVADVYSNVGIASPASKDTAGVELHHCPPVEAAAGRFPK
jgi:hypothetical protein